eukprot:993450-Karenia_brevis.AAC.1
MERGHGHGLAGKGGGSGGKGGKKGQRVDPSLRQGRVVSAGNGTTLENVLEAKIALLIILQRIRVMAIIMFLNLLLPPIHLGELIKSVVLLQVAKQIKPLVGISQRKFTKGKECDFWHPPKCKFYAQGRCQAGKNCNYVHERPKGK